MSEAGVHGDGLARGSPLTGQEVALIKYSMSESPFAVEPKQVKHESSFDSGLSDRANEDIPVEGRRVFWAINQSRDKSTRCTSGLSHHHMAMTQIKPSLIQKSPL
ncbi:unnamed protein product [Leuciscus chuanchicus]